LRPKLAPAAAKPPIFMSTVIVTGAAGLIGSESVKRFAQEGLRVVGIDNDLRRWFFGDGASTLTNRQKLLESIPNYQHHDFDIRDRQAAENLFGQLGKDIALIIHTAAQPSHEAVHANCISSLPPLHKAINVSRSQSVYNTARNAAQ
jgi:nucleoside-diphosphate-sugar epimerase